MPLRLRSVTLLAVLLVAGAAGAQARPTTQEQFASATKLFDARDYAAALAEFEALTRETGSPNARFFVARCHLLLGHLAKAYDEMSTTVRDAAARSASEPKYESTRDAAATELSVLERRVGRLLVTLAPPSPDAIVRINGVSIPSDLLGSAVSIDPGHARVEVTGPSRSPAVQDVQVAPGELKHVFFSFAPPAAPVQQPASEPRSHPLRTAAIVSGGVSLAGAVVFTAAGLTAKSRYDSLRSACGETRCTDPAKASDVDAGRSAQTIADIGLAVGIVGAIAGVTLWLVDRAGDGAVAGAVLPGGGFVSAGRRF